MYTDVPDKTYLQELVRQKMTEQRPKFRKGSSQWSKRAPETTPLWVPVSDLTIECRLQDQTL